MHGIHTTLLAAVIAAVAATPALAKDKDKHGGKGGNKHAYVQKHGGKQAKGSERHARAGDYRVRDGYRSGDRYDRYDRDGRYDRHDGYRDHRDDRYRSYTYVNCPPGLAKKNNGCLPPGQAKKLAIGQPLPAGAVYTIPRHVRVDLPPPPLGYRYALVHNQVVLVSSRDNLVVEIIRSLLG